MKATTKTVVKKVGKSFRLIDFHVCDQVPEASSSGSDEDGKGAPPKRPVGVFTIQMFGINEKGETAAIFVTDFQPFFYVRCADTWTDAHAERLLNEFRQKLGFYDAPALLSAKRVQYHPLYGFTGGKKSTFVQLTFQNLQCLSRVRNFWYTRTDDGDRVFSPPTSQGCRLALYESRLPPLLRYFHIHNISPSGWVFVPLSGGGVATTKTERTTSCQYEYVCSSRHLIPQPTKETRVPYKICSFDIEASSSHGDFPLPVKTYKRLATQVVDGYLAYTRNTAVAADEIRPLVEKMVKAAFGYGKWEDVDRVFPKPALQRSNCPQSGLPTKPAVTACLQRWWTVPCIGEDGSPIAGVGVTNTIESLFERARSADIGGGDRGEGEDDDDGDADGALEICGDGDDVLDDDDTAVAKPKTLRVASLTKTDAVPFGSANASASAPTTAVTVLDILTGKTQLKMSRDEQIQALNTAFQLANFPPLEGDKVTFIGSTFMRYGESEPYLNHCLVLDTCDPVPNVEIVSVDREADLLVAWAELMAREDPDIVIGYNIFGFDYEFMFRRAQETGCEQDFLRLSRNVDALSAKENTDRETGETTLALDNTKIVLATGEYDLRYPIMHGRIQLDLYTYFRRDFNLSSYKLDDVAGEFIRDDIQRVVLSTDDAAPATTELHTRNVAGLRAGDFIHLELSGFTSDYYRDGAKFQVLAVEAGDSKQPGSNVVRIAGHETGLLAAAEKKKLKWCMAKDDVTPQDIFRLTAGSAADRAVVAKYCIQDCNLVHHLTNKIDVLTGYVEMARICSVPISFLVFRGQGIKLTSYVAKKCREKQTLMPDLEKSSEMDGYEGAIVLPPKCAMYMDNPVACVDYSSLYPSSMISQNFSHDSKVWTKEYNLDGQLIGMTGARDPQTGKFLYDDLPGYQYIDMEFNTYKYRKNPAKPTVAAEKIKVGRKICRWAQLPGGQKSIMPAILEELLKARSDTRKLIKQTADPFMQNILDKRQLGYKVTANSLYGQCGSRTSSFYEKDVAASTTATGRMMITYAKNIIEKVYGNLRYDTKCRGPVMTRAEYVYGDSVASYTPVYIKYRDRDIRDQMMVLPIDALPKCFHYAGRWVPCLEPGKEDKEAYEFRDSLCIETWSDRGWTRLYRVIRHKLAPHKKMFRVVTEHGLVDVTDDHSLLRPDGREVTPKECTFGTPLLHHPICDGTYLNQVRYGTYLNQVRRCYADSDSGWQTRLAHEYLVKRRDSLCRPEKIHLIPGPDGDNYRFEHTGMPASDEIRHIHELALLDPAPYVYDLTTENHHFAAGVGDLIVHNTDSVFFTFNLADAETGAPIRGQDALEITIEIAQDAADLCTQWLKPPMALAYEKTLMPFVLLSKKRYVGMLYEDNPHKGKLKYMGLSLKRRDSCDYLKDTYGGILTRLMKVDGSGLQDAIGFLDASLQQLVEGNVPMDKLTITKALRGYYKNPHQIAHWVLAERIGKRDAGTKPKPGERMKFVHIEPPKDAPTGKGKLLQGDLIDVPEYVVEKKLRVDYSFYITNQLMKPLQQLFGLAVEQLLEQQQKRSQVQTFCREMEDLRHKCHKESPGVDPETDIGLWMETYMKKKEKVCSAKIKGLLFDRFLVDIHNKKHNLQSIRTFFTVKK